uniref:Ovule protein n=1 Tax=Caenorhabditis tropicalis TaxID=1561998 RepID=A0A1I7T667_9PELO
MKRRIHHSHLMLLCSSEQLKVVFVKYGIGDRGRQGGHTVFSGETLNLELVASCDWFSISFLENALQNC